MKPMTTALVKYCCVLTVLLLSMGCTKFPSGSDLFSGDVPALIAPQTVSLYEPFEVKVGISGAEVTGWQFVNEAGETMQAPCPYTTGPLLHSCVSEVSGEMTIRAQLTISGRNHVVETTLDVIDPNFEKDQSPKFILDIKDGNPTPAMTVAFARALESGQAVFSENQELTFDFSRTQDDIDAAGALKYELDFGTGYNVVGMISTHTFTQTGTYPVRLRVTDTENHTTEKSFVTYVKCDDSLLQPLAIDTNQVSIAPDTLYNFFTYNAAGAVSGGTGNYKYKWDFNGNGLYDPISRDEEWTTSTASTAYTIYGDLRSAKLSVWDTSCNTVTSATISHQFNIPHDNPNAPDGIPGNAQGPQLPGYHFLKANLTGTNGNTSPSANGKYIATQKGVLPKSERKVTCDYRKVATNNSNTQGSSYAIFTITGFNRYRSPKSSGVNHGMELRIKDIYDATAATNPEANNKTAKIYRAYKYTDEGGDQIDRKVYKKTDDCDLDIVVTPLGSGVTPCGGSGPNPGEYGVQIDGTFSCRNLRAKSGETLDAMEGSFYCEVDKIDGCVGGGGGGGGIPFEPQ